MIKTIESIKKDKNYLAHAKGYPIDPEGFPLVWLLHRLDLEYEELNKVRLMVSMSENKEPLLDELADLSNLIDYIASKIIMNYPDAYSPERIKG